MKEKVLWKRIVAFGLTAAMLMTGVSAGYAEEVSVIPNELAGISSFAEDVDPDSADTDIIEDVTNETPETAEIMSSTPLIEDQDLVAADDDSEKIEITFDGGEGSNYQGEYDEDIWEYPYDGGSTYVETIYPGDCLWILGSDSFRAEGKRLIGWKNLDTDEEYEFGDYRIFETSTTLTAVWEEAIEITFDGGEGSNYRGEYDEDLGEYPYDGGTTHVENTFPGEEFGIPWDDYFHADGKRLKGWVDLNTGNEYEFGDYCTFEASTTLTAVWEEAIKITFDGGEGSNYRGEYDEDLGEYPYDGGTTHVEIIFSDQELWIPWGDYFKADGKRLKGWLDLNTGNEYELGEYCTFETNTTLTAVWDEKIAITFDGGEGSNYRGEYDEDLDGYPYDGGSTHVEKVFSDEEVWIPWGDSFKADGKRLKGWVDLNTGVEYEFGDYVAFETDTTLTAIWDEGIKITFDGGEGSNYRGEYDEDLDEYPYDGGSTYVLTFFSDDDKWVVVPDSGDFKKAGQYLKGWVDLNTGREYEFDEEYLFTSSITLTAIWEEGVTLTLHVNGGYWGIDDEEDPPVYYTDDKEEVFVADSRVDIDDLPRPDHDDMVFAGWEDENEVLVIPRYSDESSFKATEDMDLYASWVAASVITLDPGEGYWGIDDEEEPPVYYRDVRSEKVSTGDQIYADDFEIPRHDTKAFMGWADEEDNLVLPMERDEHGEWVHYEVTGDMTLHAVWAEGYKLTLNVNNGYWDKWDNHIDNQDRTIYVAKNAPVYFSDIDEEPNHDTKYFAGWAKDKAGTQIVLSRSKRTYTPSGNTILYAVWTDPVTVTFLGNGGKTEWYNDSTGQETYVDRFTEKYAKGDIVELYGGMFERDGYVISGWKVGNTVHKGSWYEFTVNANTTVTAQWAKKVTVRWHLNGGEFKWMDPDEMEDPAVYVDEYAQGDELNFYTPEKDNYAFLGWSLKEGSDELYLERYREKNPTVQSNLDLYAVWTEAYTVTFNGNGGVCYNYDGEMSSVAQTIPKGQSIGQYGYPSFRYAGGDGLKALSHWALDENDENPVGWNDPVTEDMEVYAIWGPGVMVTFDLNGGHQYGSLSFSDVVQKDIYIGDHFYYGSGITPPAGKTFGGWSLKRNDKSTKISMYKLTQNVTLYALWNSTAPKPVPTDKITISKAPSGVKAKAAKKGKATLTWKKFKQTKKTKAIWKKIKNVEVQYSTDKTFRTGVISKKLGKKKTKLNVKKLKAKTTYYFRVRYVEGPYKVSKWSAVKKVKAKK